MAEEARLESVCTPKGYREFESRSFRDNLHFMRTPKLIITVAAALLLATVSSYGQGGENAMPFSRTDHSPVSAGMAFSGAASTSDIAWSAFKNSAVLPFYSGTFDAGVSYQLWAPDGPKSNVFNVGAAYKSDNGVGVSMGVSSLSFQSYDIIDDYGVDSGSFTPTGLVFNTGAGFLLSEDVSAGVNLRYMRQSVSESKSYDAFGADILLYYKPAKAFGLTAGVVSVGSSVKALSGDKMSLPSSAKLAGEYSVLSGDHGFKADLDLDYFFAGKFSAAAGVQYGFRDMVFVRGGYHYGDKESVLPSFATAGAGLKFSGFKLDFAWLTANEDLGNSIVIGLGYSF